MKRRTITYQRSPARALLAGAALLAATALALAGCEQPTRTWDPAVVSQESYSGQSASPIFLPSVVRQADAERSAGRTAQLPPMEWFNNRADWPAAADLPTGEVTFYRERYYDRQYSSSSGRGHIHNHLNRNFEIYRTGVMVK